MNINVFKIVFYAFAIVISVYFFVNIFSSSVFIQAISSEIIEEVSVDDYITIEGIALRSEVLLYANESFKFIRYFQKDGARLSNNSSYAAYNTAEMSAENMQRLAYLNSTITRLENTIKKSTQYNLLTVEEIIKQNIITFLNGTESGTFTASSLTTLSDLSVEVQSAFDQKLIQQDGSSYLSSVLQQLKQERTSIYSSNNTVEKTLYTSIAGFFYSSVDGYEYLDMDDFTNPTVDEYLNLISLPPQNIPSTCVGKLQHYSYWSFVALVPSEQAIDLYVGKTVYLEFSADYFGSQRVATTISSISRAQNNYSAVLFKCGTLTAELFALRKEAPHMVLKTHSGLKVSNNALRVVDGETGVYVLSAQKIVFKPVEIIYVTDSFSVVKPKGTENTRLLKVKDEVIIGGKDLFDGKIVSVTKLEQN